MCAHEIYSTSPSGIGGWFFLITGSENAAKPELSRTLIWSHTPQQLQLSIQGSFTRKFHQTCTSRCQSGATNECRIHSYRDFDIAMSSGLSGDLGRRTRPINKGANHSVSLNAHPRGVAVVDTLARATRQLHLEAFERRRSIIWYI